MFGITAYLNKVKDIEWIIKEEEVEELGDTLCVEFERKGKYYVVSKINYSAMDVLVGLEHVDLSMAKTGNRIVIKVLKLN